jgi:hypothetical protein
MLRGCVYDTLSTPLSLRYGSTLSIERDSNKRQFFIARRERSLRSEMTISAVREVSTKKCMIFRVAALFFTVAVWSGNCYSHLTVPTSTFCRISNPRRHRISIESFVRGGASRSSNQSLAFNSHCQLTIPQGHKVTSPTHKANAGTMAESTVTALRAGSSSSEGTKCPVTKPIGILSSFWGSFGVVYILYKAIARVFPIALEPFKGAQPPLTGLQLA